jgi:hypothetical protein
MARHPGSPKSTRPQRRDGYRDLLGPSLQEETDFRAYREHNDSLVAVDSNAFQGETKRMIEAFREMDEAQRKPATPRRKYLVKIRDRRQVIRYANVIISALQEALDYDHNQPHNFAPPALWISDPSYLHDVRILVEELKKLNELLSKRITDNAAATRSVSRFAKHFNEFLKSYAKSMGVVVAGLTGGAAIALMDHAGASKEIIETIWGHLKLPK